MSDFDIQGARKAGYSDAEIADHLASVRGFDVGAARQAGYKDKEIVDHLSPPASLGRRALTAVGEAADTAFEGLNTGVNYVGTQAVKAAGGIAGIPKAVGEGMDWVSRTTGAPVAAFGPPALMAYLKDKLPSGEDVSKAFFEATGAPEVKLEGNVPGGKIIDMAVQGALSAPFSGPLALSGALGGAGSEIAGQLAEGTPYETPARIVGGLAGGVTGAATAAGGRKIAKIASAMRKPLTVAGRDDVVGGALARGAADLKASIANIDKYVIGREAFPDSVPGFKIDAGRASRDPGLMAIADTIPDRIRGSNVQNNNVALTGALDTAAAGMPAVDGAGGTVQKILADRFKALQEARSAAATPLYTAARNFPEDLPVGGLFKYVDDTIASNKGEPKAVMESARKLLFNAKGEPDFSAQGLMAARDGLKALFTPTLDKHTRELLVGLRNRIDETMQTIPEAKAARATFAEKSVPIEPFSKKTHAAKIVETDPITKKFTLPEGKVLGDLKAQDVQNILMASGGDPTVKRNIAALYIDDFKNSVGNAVQRDQTGRPMLGAYPAAKWMDKHRGGARNVLTDDQIRALDDIAKHLEDQAQTVPGRSGSPTFDRLGTQSILAAVISPKHADAPWLHFIRRGLGLAYGGADEAIMNRLYEVIQDPALTRALMKKATEGNAKLVEPLLQQLAKGAAAGELTSGERGSR